jgi:hypothetical protein
MTTAMTRATIAIVRVSMAPPYSVSLWRSARAAPRPRTCSREAPWPNWSSERLDLYANPDEELRRFHETAERYGYWNATPEENAAVGIVLLEVPA